MIEYVFFFLKVSEIHKLDLIRFAPQNKEKLVELTRNMFVSRNLRLK